MNPSLPNNGWPPPPPPPASTNNIDEPLSQSLRHLSLKTASATPLPPSPQVASPQRTLGQHSHPSSPSANGPPRSPLRRSPSSMSVDGRSSTPTSLQRKASMNSLRGAGGSTPPRTSQPRRSSSTQFTNGSSSMGRSPLSEVEDAPAPPLPPTAADIASGHFKKELDIHTDDLEGKPTETIVILHDSCYGHRFSRPRTSKAGLMTIVERPERIHASILGVSVAYVRLGERHAEGRYPIHPKKNPSNIPSIPFRIRKTARKLALSSPAVTNVHGVKWMEELKIMCDGAEAKLAMNGKELTRPEMTRSPDQGAPSKLHEGDLYLCSESLNAMEGALGAVCEGVDAVFQGAASGKGPRRAFVAIRPPGHHCSASYPSGFCWLNNVHVGIAHATLTHGLTHAAIIDFDLHHGDGSQAIAWDHNTRSQGLPKNAAAWKKTSIGYFSLHDINSYPCEMGDEEKVKNASLCIENAHGQSIWNVHLQPWKSEAEFWELYETKYSVLLEKTRNFLRHHTQRFRSLPSSLPNAPQPKAAIFLSAGFDASEWESSGMQRHKVNVPTEFYARLTRDVVKLAAEEGCSVGGRVISVLEGGYSDRALSSGVLSHLSGLAGDDPMEVKTEVDQTGLGYEMAKKAGAFSVTNGGLQPDSALTPTQPYDSSWWALSQLEHLDGIVHPPPPPPEPKKPKDTPPPTYFSSTQSFSAKIVASPKAQRTPSGLSAVNGSSPRLVSRPPSPPPPDIYWATAAHELSKLLIPTDRQTMSCKPEDLSAEATRARRDRQSILTTPTTSNSAGAPSAAPVRMALRERKAAKPLSTPEEEEEKPISRVNRRKTVAGSAVLVAEKDVARSTTPKPEPGYTQPTKQSTRRLSMASASGSVTSEAPTMPISNGHARTSSFGQKTVSNRPGSSQSLRPDSVMSSRGHSIPPVVVKKTRTANAARTDAAKPPRVKRTPSAQIAGTAKSPHGTDGAIDVQPPRLPSSTQPLGSKPLDNSSSSEMDSLTTGMKKIKINLTTKAQREAREQAKLAAAMVATGTAAASKRPSLKNTKSSSEKAAKQSPPLGMKQESQEPQSPPQVPSVPLQKTRSRPPSPSTPQPTLPSRVSHLQKAAAVPLPTSSPPGPSNHLMSVASTPPSLSASSAFQDPGVFIAYQPEGPAPAPLQQQEPLKWLPPNTSTPSPMKRGDLPIFSATGAIPFAVAANKEFGPPHVPAQGPQVKQENLKPGTSIWDVPETPGR